MLRLLLNCRILKKLAGCVDTWNADSCKSLKSRADQQTQYALSFIREEIEKPY